MGSLYFGDNLYVLRDEIKSESVNLVYLDPPFNSKRDYNLLFKTPKGQESDAQIAAFDDSWHWGEQAEREFSELLHQENTDVSEMIQSLRRFLKESDMMAYLVMMANRLVELHRVLKPNGSLYLHCDPTASHYLKIVLDTVFGAENYQNEIVWKRSGSHGGAKRWGPLHDTILFYSKNSNFTWNKVFEKYDESYLDNFYRFSDERGRYRLVTLTGAGTRTGDSGKSWRDVNPTTVGRHWAVPLGALRTIADEKTIEGLSTQEKLDLLDSAGLIYWPPKGSVPQQKRYIDESEGVSIQDVITDILPISSQAAERLGYPTQKPLALLERIIQASSNEGDVVLDPFCGCGTAVHAAETLKREWIGIDITHLAISLIEKRMKGAFPNVTFQVYGTPTDLEGARNLAERDKYQFQWWACSLVNAQPFQGKKKGSDGGIDGLIFFQDDNSGAKKIIVSVKGGEHVSVTMVKDLIATVEREKAAMGLFVTLAEPTKPMTTEAVTAGFYESPKGEFPKIQILTIADLLSGKAKPQFFDISSGVYNFKKAKVERRKAEQKQLL
jgi:site-specific DNA-methyltransferase (adenine-specific)